MSTWRMVLADVLLVLGTAAMTLAIVAVLRIPSSYAKIHAAAKGVVIGVVAVLLASVVATKPEVFVRALLVGGFLLLTSPVSAHALARLELRLRRQRE